MPKRAPPPFSVTFFISLTTAVNQPFLIISIAYINLQNPSFGRIIKAGGFDKLPAFLHYLSKNPFTLNPYGAFHSHRIFDTMRMSGS